MLKSLLVAALFLLATPAVAGSDEDVDGAVSANIGDPAAVHEAFDAIKAAVADGDAAALAAWVAYPIEVRVGGKTRTVKTEKAFVAAYDTIVTPAIAAVVTNQAWGDLFVNDQGAMFGNGEVWIAGVCADDACETPDIRIITIQDAQ